MRMSRHRPDVADLRVSNKCAANTLMTSAHYRHARTLANATPRFMRTRSSEQHTHADGLLTHNPSHYQGLNTSLTLAQTPCV